jgi:hypothetical protein
MKGNFLDITEWELSEFDKDVSTGMVSFGIPEMYHIYEAIYYGDEEALAYHLKVAGVVHGTWYSAYQLGKMWELYRHGRGMLSFHEAMAGKGQALRAGASLAARSAVWLGPLVGVLAITYDDGSPRSATPRSDAYARRNRATYFKGK